VRAPSDPILRWVSDLRGVSLEISGDDLLAAGVPEGPAMGHALDETLNRKLDGMVSGREAELETALLLAREHAQ
jgi:tRNA nucleotidyltransferase (CCA-adding enzyme)